MGMTQPKNTHHVLFVYLNTVSCFYSWQEQAILLFPKHAHLSIQWVMGTSALEVKKQTCEADHSPP
jgi:hypothetical protein